MKKKSSGTADYNALNFLPFGIGQFRQGRPVIGGVLGGGQAMMLFLYMDRKKQITASNKDASATIAEINDSGVPAPAETQAYLERNAAYVKKTKRNDGRGLDLAAIQKKAARAQVFVNKTDQPIDIASLIFQPELSTKDSVSLSSGRGVGMGALRHLAEEAGGSLTLVLGEKREGFSGFQLDLNLPGLIAKDKRARSQLTADWKIP